MEIPFSTLIIIRKNGIRIEKAKIANISNELVLFGSKQNENKKKTNPNQTNRKEKREKTPHIHAFKVPQK